MPRRRQNSIGVMRWIDHWVGLPLCFLLGVLVSLVRKIRPRRPCAIRGTRPIVVFKFFGLGAIMQATPLLRAIRRRYPEAHLTFVSFAANEGLLRRLGLCDEVRIIRTGPPWQFVADTLRHVVWMRRRRVEAVLDLEFFSKFSTLVAFLSGAPVRIGFHLNDFWRYTLVTHPVYFNYYRHITDVYRQMAERLDVMIHDLRLSRIEPEPAAATACETLLREHGWAPGTPLLAVNVNAGDMSLERRWPIERFADVAATLLSRHAALRIVLTGSPDERDYVVTLVDRLPDGLRDRVIVAAGRWTLDELLGAFSRFRGFLTNDSGPMHLAASYDVPMVSLWGPGRPEFYAPRGALHRTIYQDYPCSPCLYMFTAFEGMWCGHEGWCMRAIEVPAVVEAVETMLTAAAARAERESLS